MRRFRPNRIRRRVVDNAVVVVEGVTRVVPAVVVAIVIVAVVVVVVVVPVEVVVCRAANSKMTRFG